MKNPRDRSLAVIAALWLAHWLAIQAAMLATVPYWGVELPGRFMPSPPGIPPWYIRLIDSIGLVLGSPLVWLELDLPGNLIIAANSLIWAVVLYPLARYVLRRRSQRGIDKATNPA